jgi:type I restriction enzyme S subunit
VSHKKATCDKSHYEQLDIPNTWGWIELGDVCELSNGISKRKADSGIPTIVLRLADLDEENISFVSTRTINLSEKEINQYRLENGDLLFVRVNGSKSNVGKSYIFENNL